MNQSRQGGCWIAAHYQANPQRSKINSVFRAELPG